MTALKELLTQYDADVLKDLAREHGVNAKNQSKSALANSLAQRFAQREHVERAFSSLNPVEREMVARIQRAGGEVAVGALGHILRKTGMIERTKPHKKQTPWGYQEEDWNPAGDPRYSDKPTLEDAAARLLLLGLVCSREVAVPLKQVIGWELGRYLVIPHEIRTLLPAGGAEKMPPAAEPSRVEHGSARNFQRDLSRYWSFVRRAEKLQLTAQGYVYKKSLQELAKALGWTEDKKREEKNDLYAFFLRRMLVALDLLQPEKDAQGWSHPDASVYLANDEKNFWQRPPTERVKASFETFLGATTWNELRIPKASYGYDHRRAAPPELKQARRVVVEFVKQRGATGWVNLADLLDDIRLGRYEFLFPRPARPQAYYGYGPNYSSPYYQSNNPFGISYADIKNETEGWGHIEGAIITHIIAGPLHWLGLTDLGFDQNNDAPRAYRLTAMGAWLLGVGSPVTIVEEGGRVVVQPNFQVVAMEPIAENVLTTLDEFSQFEGGDHALTYRLTRESVYRGQRAGWDAARIIAYLEDTTHAPLPQNVKRSLEEWQSLHERVTFWRGVSLVQAEDAATLDELLANGALASRLGRRAGDQVALPATRENAQNVGAALREAGWLPILTRRDQTDAPASVVADDEGNVTLVHRTPSIYAYEGIEPFAERVDTRHARITPASVAAATRQNISVPTMIARLRQVHRGEIPAKLIARLKAWGKYYGGAKLGTLTLIEFRDEQARGELLADPELKPYLTRFDAGARPLALVQSDALERVQALLEERGVEIRAFEGAKGI
jgi:hypothetical protein